MFDDYEDQSEASGSMIKSERCKPDYEGMIKSENTKLHRAEVLLEATTNYLGPNRLSKDFRELVGKLYLEIQTREFTVNRLLKEQEADSE